MDSFVDVICARTWGGPFTPRWRSHERYRPLESNKAQNNQPRHERKGNLLHGGNP